MAGISRVWLRPATLLPAVSQKKARPGDVRSEHCQCLIDAAGYCRAGARSPRYIAADSSATGRCSLQRGSGAAAALCPRNHSA